MRIHLGRHRLQHRLLRPTARRSVQPTGRTIVRLAVPARFLSRRVSHALRLPSAGDEHHRDTIIVCALCYVAAATGASAHLFPVREAYPLHRFLALTPSVLVVCLSNGFQEELLFRGLFLQRYRAVFGKHTSNLLQATIFTTAHAGITYTPTAIIFVVVFVFPLGLITGYLMRTTNGIVAPVILHAGTDIPIYGCISELRIHLMN